MKVIKRKTPFKCDECKERIGTKEPPILAGFSCNIVLDKDKYGGTKRYKHLCKTCYATK